MSLRHYGHGPQAALALHCSLAHAGEWSALGAALDDLVTITACDLPGHGRAPDWVPGTDLGDAALAVAEAALPPGQVDLIGHSFGGGVALRLALAHPGRVRRLVLIEPTIFAAADRAARAALARAQDPYEAALVAGRAEDAAEAFLGLWGTGLPWDVLPGPQRSYIEARIHLIRAAGPMLTEDNAGMLAPGRLEGLAVPVLILDGGASPPIVGAIAAALAARLPQARRVTLPDAGHMLPVTHAPAVAGAIRAFLNPG